MNQTILDRAWRASTEQYGKRNRDTVLDVEMDGGTSEVFYHSRPTNTWDADWPTVMRVGSQKQLQVEEWVRKVTGRNAPGTGFQFDLYGSLTGFDGSGSSTQPFVSSAEEYF